jgi:hypothetical protein
MGSLSARDHSCSKFNLNRSTEPRSRVSNKSLSCRFSPMGEKFADPDRSVIPSIE